MVIPEERNDRYTPWTDYGARFRTENIIFLINEVYSDNLVKGHQVMLEAVTLLIDGAGIYRYQVFIAHNLAELFAADSGNVVANTYFVNNLDLLLIETIHVGARVVGGGAITYFTMDIAGKQRSLRK